MLLLSENVCPQHTPALRKHGLERPLRPRSRDCCYLGFTVSTVFLDQGSRQKSSCFSKLHCFILRELHCGKWRYKQEDREKPVQTSAQARRLAQLTSLLLTNTFSRFVDRMVSDFRLHVGERRVPGRFRESLADGSADFQFSQIVAAENWLVLWSP
ncbi:hypothetical protein RRG08_047609 [Elysia crispata]|uniref:Uncharacterized protein n=1 Tax=Elysia crispata TaxID=231223 RepID=A0AAE1BFG6_9GAST|nr:hypothetical protein RRG08_047609 [Elysia crispata]